MPTKTCKRCGKRISYSKIDRFEDIHICFSKFKDRLEDKPVINIKQKQDDTTDEVSDNRASTKDNREVKRYTKNVQD